VRTVVGVVRFAPPPTAQAYRHSPLTLLPVGLQGKRFAHRFMCLDYRPISFTVCVQAYLFVLFPLSYLVGYEHTINGAVRFNHSGQLLQADRFTQIGRCTSDQTLLLIALHRERRKAIIGINASSAQYLLLRWCSRVKTSFRIVISFPRTPPTCTSTIHASCLP